MYALSALFGKGLHALARTFVLQRSSRVGQGLYCGDPTERNSSRRTQIYSTYKPASHQSQATAFRRARVQQDDYPIYASTTQRKYGH